RLLVLMGDHGIDTIFERGARPTLRGRKSVHENAGIDVDAEPSNILAASQLVSEKRPAPTDFRNTDEMIGDPNLPHAVANGNVENRCKPPGEIQRVVRRYRIQETLPRNLHFLSPASIPGWRCSIVTSAAVSARL